MLWGADPWPHREMQYVLSILVNYALEPWAAGGRAFCVLLKAAQPLFVRTYWAVERVRGVKPVRTQPVVLANNRLYLLTVLSWWRNLTF